MTAFGGPSSTLMQIEQTVMTALGQALGEVGQMLTQLDSTVRTGLATGNSGPLLTNLAMEKTIRQGLSQDVANAAEQASYAVGEPIHLTQAGNPVLGPITSSTYNPVATVSDMQATPIGSGGATGGSGPAGTGSNASTSGSSVGAGGSAGSSGVGASNDQFGGHTFGGGTTGGGGATGFVNNPPPGWMICPPGVERFPEGVQGCQGITDPQLQAKCMESIGYWCPVPTATQTPTTPTPTVPTPTTPTPTVPTPTTPTPTVPTPTTPTSPPIGSPPTQPPPITVTPLPPPIGSPPQCPPGTTYIPSGSLGTPGTCEAPIPLTPIPPEQPPPPIGTPPPIGNPPPSTPVCDGSVPQKPCFRASNPPGENLFPLLVTSGIAQAASDGAIKGAKVDPATIPDPKLNGGLVDNADQTLGCTIPYQMNLIDEGNQVIDVLPAFGDLMGVFSQNTDQLGVADKVAVWTFWLPIAVVLNLLFATVSKVVTYAGSFMVTLNARMQGEAVQKTTLAILNMVTFGALDRVMRIFNYQANFNYPVGLPTPEQAGSGWLANVIDDCTFETYVKAGDTRFAPFKAIVTASKFKFTADQLKALDLRGSIVRGSFASRMRELGSLEGDDLTEMDALSRYIPGPSELIRYMTRDVENEEVVTRFQTDDQFDQNFTGLVEQWAGWQGVGVDVMQREWRAHWSIPSPTQLYEMLHRLRHDPNYGGPDQVLADVKAALIQQDILPFWIPRLLAISYHPLTRTDLNRAYERGWIDDDAYVSGMYQNGYSDDDAKTLLRFVQQERALALRHSDFFRSYTDGFISAQQFRDLMTTEGYDDSLVTDALTEAEYFKGIEQQKLQIQALIRQYKACRVSKAEVVDDAASLGIDESLITWWLNVADWNSTCGTRRESAAQLCTALSQEIVTADEYVARMKILKYDDDAITRMLTLCENKIASAKAKAALAKQKQQDAEQAKEQAQAQKAARQAAQAARTAANTAAKVERGRQSRNRLLMDATSKLAATVGGDALVARDAVDSLYESLQSTFGLSQNEAANALSLAATKYKGADIPGFITYAESVGEAALAEPWSLFPVG